MDRYDFGASPELLLRPSVLSNGVYAKKSTKGKTGVLCEGQADTRSDRHTGPQAQQTQGQVRSVFTTSLLQ